VEFGRVIGYLIRGASAASLIFLCSCETPEKQALKALEAAGIEPNGASLVEAVTARDSATAALLIQARVHIGQRDATGRTPLRIAVDVGDVATARLLLENGANPNALAEDGHSILGLAAVTGLHDLLEPLIAAGAPAKCLTPEGERLLVWALREQARDLAELLVRSGAAPNLPIPATGHAPLHLALRNGWHSDLPVWIAAGADPNLPDGDGRTPLALAARNQDLEQLSALLDCGADPNLTGSSGESACHAALQGKWRDGLARLARSGADWDLPDADGQKPLETALRDGDRETVAFLLAEGTTPAPDDWNRWLRHCLLRRDLHTARILLRHGTPAGSGAPLVEAAAAAGSGTFIKLFLDHGLAPGRALEITCHRGDSMNARLLLACGVSARHGPAPFTGSPLAEAIRHGNDGLAALLLDAGADPNVRLPEGQLPLHLAVVKGCHRTVMRLIAGGADVNAPLRHPVDPAFIAHVRPGVMRWALKNDENITPLMISADAGDLETSHALLRAGASQSVWTRKTKIWPINFASRREDIKMMRALLGQDPENEERHIVISLSEQRARMFDAAGNEIFSTRVSTGKKGFATPKGEFVITNKYRDWTSTLYDAKMPHFQRLSCSDFGFHAGVVPGYPASHGCIRMPPADAARLFKMTRTGDRVKIVP
jgi:ankyrin repeat protein